MRAVAVFLRPWYWVPALASALAGFMVRDGMSLPPSMRLVLLFVLVGPCLCGFAEGFNDICDLEDDRRLGPKRLLGIPISGGSGILVGGRLQLRAAKGICAACALGGFLVAIVISPMILLFYSIGLVLAVGYSLNPIRLKTRGVLGLVAQGLGYGPIVFWIGLVMNGGMPNGKAVLWSLLIGVWVASVGSSADILDVESDKANGVGTLAVRLGQRGMIAYVVFVSVAVLGIAGALMREFYSVRLFVAAGVGLVYTVYVGELLHSRSGLPPARIHAEALVLEALFPFLIRMA